MSKTKMIPYNPNHKGEFCTKDGRKVHIWATDMDGAYPIQGYIISTDGERKLATTWTETGALGFGATSSDDLMCMILNREARVIEIDDKGVQISGPSRWDMLSTKWREVMPDDISQEKAHALLEAAKRVAAGGNFAPGMEAAEAFNALRAAINWL